MLQDETEAKLMVQTRFKPDADLACPVLYSEELFEQLNRVDPVELFEDIQPHDTLEIVYTSGTTGKPKGVVLSHQNIASNVKDIMRVITVDESFHMLSVLPLSHSLEQTCGFWTPFWGGGTVTYIQTLKPSAILDVFERVPITCMVVVPRLLQLLKEGIERQMKEKHLTAYLKAGLTLSNMPVALRKIWFYPIHKRFNTRFKFFVCGGSYLEPDVEIFWKSMGFEVCQGYGLTETSPVLTCAPPGETKLSSVGRALPSVELRLDKDKEILAKGPNIFSGYYKRPDLTKTVFEQEWFKTGDIGELDGDSYLYIRSRKKDMIVTSDGVNVYPEDIEREVNRLEEVKESCILGVGENESQVHAVVILKDSAASLDAVIEKSISR